MNVNDPVAGDHPDTPDLNTLVRALRAAPDRASMERLLIGVSPTACLSGGETVLMLMAATHDANANRFDVLLEHLDANAVDANGWTALFHAVANGRLAIAQRLLPRTTHLTKPSGYTAMMLAASNASVPMLELLAPRSNLGDTALCPEGQHTALDRAIHRRNWANVRWLIEHTPLPQAWAALARAPTVWPSTMPPSNPAAELKDCQRRLAIRQSRYDAHALDAVTPAQGFAEPRDRARL